MAVRRGFAVLLAGDPSAASMCDPCYRHHAGSTFQPPELAAALFSWQQSKALERRPGTPSWRGVTAQPRGRQHWLLARASPWRGTPKAIDPVPAATLSLIRAPICARLSMSLILVARSRGCRPSCVCRPDSSKGPCVMTILIDLISSYSIDAAVSIFTDSDGLRPSILP